MTEALEATEADEIQATAPGSPAEATAEPDAVFHLRVDLIDQDPTNVRQTAASEEQQQQLRESIRAQGVLSPILVRPHGPFGRYMVVYGGRRLAMTKELGLPTIPALVRDLTEAQARAAQAAENMVRAAMTPIDQWLAIVDMLKTGIGLVAAGEMLGLSRRKTEQLARLGSMAPEIIAEIRRWGMPPEGSLILIAEAPVERQQAALKAPSAYLRDGEILWWKVAELCKLAKIPRDRARFDVEASGVVFEADLFAADPTSAFTSDVAGFLAAQRAWLEAQVAAEVEAGYRVLLVDTKGAEHPATPKDHEQRYEPPENGDPWPRFGKRSKKTTLLYVSGSGHHLGEVLYQVVQPKEKPKAKEPGAAKPGAQIPAPEVSPLTDSARRRIAQAKTRALQGAFAEMAETAKPRADMVLPLLLLALTGSNARLSGGESGFSWLDTDWLAAELVTEDGHLTARAADLAPAVACRLLSHLVVAPFPRMSSSTGEAADWIGRHLGLALPRFDTPDFLAECTGEVLRGAATAAGIKPPAKVGDLRKVLTGNAEAWRPPGAAWEAPGPDANERSIALDARADLEEEIHEWRKPKAPAKKGRGKRA